MSTITTSDLFVKTYADVNYRFPTMVRHNGAVVAFAMDAHRRIHYTVLDFGAGGSTSTNDADHWSPNPQLLTFAERDRERRIRRGRPGAVADGPHRHHRGGTGRVRPCGPTNSTRSCRPLRGSPLRSPFQVVSDGRYVYLFRQAITEPDAAAVTAAELALLDPHATDDLRRPGGRPHHRPGQHGVRDGRVGATGPRRPRPPGTARGRRPARRSLRSGRLATATQARGALPAQSQPDPGRRDAPTASVRPT